MYMFRNIYYYVTYICNNKEKEAMNLSESKVEVVYDSCLEGEKGKGKLCNK